uniref:Ovule protein n=1 Tax=Romanomermis culicivorax TaxID=13658 RepID=A0A915HVW2_ROMCU
LFNFVIPTYSNSITGVKLTELIDLPLIFLAIDFELFLPYCIGDGILKICLFQRVSECSHAKCMDDCNLKGWTAWSNCESHWNQ